MWKYVLKTPTNFSFLNLCKSLSITPKLKKNMTITEETLKNKISNNLNIEYLVRMIIIFN